MLRAVVVAAGLIRMRAPHCVLLPIRVIRPDVVAQKKSQGFLSHAKWTTPVIGLKTVTRLCFGSA
ncbi:unnamed protein product [Timema podura]|uniref:Secreted protein n=1 Tax=Timema podura TaxID=61482 RepID=A0ABN7P3C8_TIMPD|nr:unnamed protein product [Timema podura]